MSKKLSKFRAVLLLMLGANLFSSCAGSDVEEQIESTLEPTLEPTLKPTLEPTLKPTLEPAVESESFPTGTFFREIGASYQEFEFFDDGTYTWGFVKGIPVVGGDYDVDGQTLSFLSETGLVETWVGDCATILGSYTWTFEDKVLLIEVDTDDCEERAEEHDGKEYVLKEE